MRSFKKINTGIFYTILFVSILGFQARSAGAAEPAVPAGMQAVQVTGGYRIVVPEGAKITRVGAQIIVEPDKEYFSRRIYELSQEIAELKEQIKILQDQVAELKEQLRAKNTQTP